MSERNCFINTKARYGSVRDEFLEKRQEEQDEDEEEEEGWRVQKEEYGGGFCMSLLQFLNNPGVAQEHKKKVLRDCSFAFMNYKDEHDL